MRKKIVILIAGIVLITTIFIYYRHWNLREEFVEWSIYRNKEYNFEIRYPSDLNVKDWASETQNWEVLVYFGENKKIGDGSVYIGIEKGINNIEQMCKESLVPKIEMNGLKDVFVGREKYPAKGFSYKGSLHNLLPEDCCIQKEKLTDEQLDFVRYFIEHEGNLYQLQYTKSINGKVKLEESVFNKMLSAFRFLN